MNENSLLVVFGGGGHAKVMIDAAEKQGFRQILIVDDEEKNWGKLLMGYRVLGGRKALLQLDERPLSIVAVGNNSARVSISGWMENEGFPLATVIHPSVQIGRGAKIGRGSFLVARAVINSDAIIGANVIVNTAATVDHDCVIGDGVHLAPGVHLCGGVEIGEGSFLGVGAIVIPSIHIGVNCVVGAGSIVLGDIPDNSRVAGMPARPLRKTD